MKNYCECCGTDTNIVLGHGTIFDEFNFICVDCLSKLYAQECEPTPLEVAQEKLKSLNVDSENIYGFHVDGKAVKVDYFNKARYLITETLVNCHNNDEAIDVLCILTD